MITKEDIIGILLSNEDEVDNHNEAVFNEKYGKVADEILRRVKKSNDIHNVSDASCANCTKRITNYRTGIDHLRHYCSLEDEGTFLTEPENHKCGKWEDDR